MSTEREDIKKIEKEIDEENVRIVLFGQPGSGKSSLINAVCGREAVKTGELMEPTTDAVVVENGDEKAGTVRLSIFLAMERMDSRKKLFSNGSGLFNTTFFSASFLISCGLLTHGYSACWKP